MKKIVLAVAAVAASAQPAIAGDNATFEGPYVGVQAAVARAHTTHSDQQYWYTGAQDAVVEDSDVIGGVHAGYNVVKGSLLAGVEAEVNFGALDTYREATPLDPTYSIGSRTTMLGSVRAKLGLASDTIAANINGGFAFSNSKHNYLESDGSDDYFNDKGSRSGWVVGLGFDYAVSANSTLGLSVSHYQFGTKDHLLLDSTGAQNDCSWSSTAAPDNLCHFPVKDRFESVAVKYSYRF